MVKRYVIRTLEVHTVWLWVTSKKRPSIPLGDNEGTVNPVHSLFGMALVFHERNRWICRIIGELRMLWWVYAEWACHKVHFPCCGLYNIRCASWEKTFMTYANSKSPDERAHPCSLIWLCPWHILQNPLILKAGNEGPDQPARLRRLIWACVVRKLHKGPFRSTSGDNNAWEL